MIEGSGFDDFSGLDEVGGEEEANEEAPIQHPKALGKGAVSLKLGADDEDEETPVIVKKSTATPTMKASSADEEVMAMAERILG